MYHEMEYRVTYADTDQMGVVYYANYLVYFERSRTEMFRAAGLPYRELEKQGIVLPVLEAFCKYIVPARYDDLLTLRSWVQEVKGVRLLIGSEVRHGNELLVSGHVMLASVNKERKVVRLTKEIMDCCEKYFWNPEDKK